MDRLRKSWLGCGVFKAKCSTKCFLKCSWYLKGKEEVHHWLTLYTTKMETAELTKETTCCTETTDNSNHHLPGFKSSMAFVTLQVAVVNGGVDRAV